MTIDIDPIVVIAVIMALLFTAAAAGWFIIWWTDRQNGRALEASPLLRRADDHSWTDRKRDQPGTIFIDDQGVERIAPDGGQYPEPDWEQVEREAKS